MTLKLDDEGLVARFIRTANLVSVPADLQHHRPGPSPVSDDVRFSLRYSPDDHIILSQISRPCLTESGPLLTVSHYC